MASDFRLVILYGKYGVSRSASFFCELVAYFLSPWMAALE